MPFQYEINGGIYEFEKEPTEEEIDEVASQNPAASKMSNEENMNQPEIGGIEKQNLLGGIFNVPAAGIRSAIQGKGYRAGIMNPSSVATFQDIAIESVQKTTSPTANFLLSIPASTVGLIADTVTNPADVLATIVGKLPATAKIAEYLAATKAGKAIKSVATAKITPVKWVNTPIKWVKDALFGSGKVKSEAAAQVTKITQEAAAARKVASSSALKPKTIVKQLEQKASVLLDQQEQSMEQALRVAEKKYLSKVERAAFQETKSLRKRLPELFRNKSEEYGRGLKLLLEKNPINASKVEVLQVLDDSLRSHGIIDDAGKILRTPANTAEKQVFGEWMRLKDLSDDSIINASELIASQQSIRPKFGKAWTSGEHLQAQVSEGLSELIADRAPDIANYRKAYAPFLDWKKQVIAEFQPFKGKLGAKKGVSLFNNFGNAQKKLTTYEQELIQSLKKQVGKEIGDETAKLRPLGKEIQTRKLNVKSVMDEKKRELAGRVSDKLATINSSIDAKITDIMSQKEMSIQDVRRIEQEILDDLLRRKIILAGVGTVVGAIGFSKVKNYISNRLLYGMGFSN